MVVVEIYKREVQLAAEGPSNSPYCEFATAFELYSFPAAFASSADVIVRLWAR